MYARSCSPFSTAMARSHFRSLLASFACLILFNAPTLCVSVIGGFHHKESDITLESLIVANGLLRDPRHCLGKCEQSYKSNLDAP